MDRQTGLSYNVRHVMQLTVGLGLLAQALAPRPVYGVVLMAADQNASQHAAATILTCVGVDVRRTAGNADSR